MRRRLTRKDIDEAFGQFIGTLGGLTATQMRADREDGSTIGGYQLYVTGAGADTGYRIDRVVTFSGGTFPIFGDRMFTGCELLSCMAFAQAVVRTQQQQLILTRLEGVGEYYIDQHGQYWSSLMAYGSDTKCSRCGQTIGYGYMSGRHTSADDPWQGSFQPLCRDHVLSVDYAPIPDPGLAAAGR